MSAFRPSERARTRYAIVGTGSRAHMYVSALTGEHADVGELVALCDVNQSRMDFHNERIAAAVGRPVPTYHGTDLSRMVTTESVDRVIVTSVDRTHHRYIVDAMRLGCDVISEKPMTIDAGKCQEILDAVRDTGRRLDVTFNCRYSPRNARTKELLASGAIGEVLSVHFEWLLDTRHGADYFRRWHRDKRNSGGLLVHKASHHFDLVNWWLDAAPDEVFAMGDLRFYGRANAEARGVTTFYGRAHGSPQAKDDPFAIDLSASPTLRGLYLEAEHEDGYWRDQSVFGDGISIEDTMAVIVRYDNRALMSYSLNAHCPWEGYRAMFNGSRGRLELEVCERAYVSASRDEHDLAGQRDAGIDPSAADDDAAPQRRAGTTLVLQEHWQPPRAVRLDEDGAGGHGGGDVRLLADLLRGAGDDPLGRAAGPLDGAYSALTGVAANRALATGAPVRIRDLISL